MKEAKNGKIIEWVAAILSLIGVGLLIFGPRYIETEYDLSKIGSGIFLMSLIIWFVFENKSDQQK